MRSAEESFRLLPGQGAIKVLPAAWPVRCFERVNDDKGEVIGFYYSRFDALDNPEHTIFNLPTEFFSHELMDVNINDDDELFDFVNRWGIPYDPRATHKDERISRFLPAEVRASRYWRFEVVTQSEVWETLDDLRLTVKNMFDLMRGGIGRSEDSDEINLGNYFDVTLLSAGAKGQRAVLRTEDYKFDIPSTEQLYVVQGGLTSAICNQIIDFIADPALPWICEARDCNRIFKRQRRFQKSGAGVSPVSDSIYCSDRCREREKQRNRREKMSATKQKEVEQ